MNTRTVMIALCAAAGGVLTGCISSHSTKYQDTARVKVSFETEKAGRVFYEALSDLQSKTPREESKNSVNLILIDFERRTVSGPNAVFNVAVAQCDTDQNAMISEREAEIFATASKRRRDA